MVKNEQAYEMDLEDVTLASLSKTLKANSNKSGKIGKDKNYFSCSSCNESFSSKTKLLTHCYVTHNIGIKCKLCLGVFTNSSTVISHIISKHAGMGFTCCICNFHTDKASIFRKHINEEDCKRKIKSLVIKISSNGLPSTSENGEVIKKEKAPKKRTYQKKNHACDQCESSFTLKNQLLAHKNQQHGAEIRCDICNQVFNSMVSLRSHKFTKHTGKDKICEICGYSTKKTYDFKRHQVKHSSVYTIKCTVCNKGFYSQYEFNEHKNVHTFERPYQCEVCGVDYSRRSSLILHRNRKHPEIYDLSKRCQICNQVCLTKETMAAHIKTHVEGRKRFYCDICGKGLLTRVILKIHRRSHTGEKPFDCNYCGRAFSCKKNLSVHIRLHTGDRPYTCKFCWKAYTKSSALKAHEKCHANHQMVPL